MTIRYTCPECESVLKIKDELGGAEAKCPKCKTAFRIPFPKANKNAQAGKSPNLKKPAAKPGSNPVVTKPTGVATVPGTLEAPVDMPQEVTPPISFAGSDEFDVMSVLAGGSGSMPAVPAIKPSVPDAPKPSVAELMREHEQKMKEKQKRRGAKEKKGGLAEAAAVATDFTSGTASDALSRTYDQKRVKSSEAPALTREEQREAEYREGMKQFAMRAVAGLGGVLLLGYLLISWMMSESMPDLEYVSGVVTLEGRPLSGVEVTFAPFKALDGTDLAVASASSGYTNTAGEFVLMYTPDYEGALPGIHRISIMNPSGIVYRVPQEISEQRVDPEKENIFQISL